MAITTMGYDVYELRKQFPILRRELNGKPLVYFDNAATSQKPQSVINALVDYYTHYNANIHRGIHTLAEEATAAYEATREASRAFINAASVEEIIFTRGVTEGINLVAYTWGRQNIKKDDEIIITSLEHHSNIVPWQMLCELVGARLQVVPIDENGEILLEAYYKLLSPRTKLVSVVHASNSLGIINPIKEIIEAAHNVGALVMVDGAQSTVHLDIDVQAMDCDFFALSSHKMYGPTGTGVLYGKKEILEAMPPFHGGGEMIKEVSFAKTTYNDLPYKFEAGTPNIADTVAMKAAIDFINNIGKANMRAHEDDLLRYATEQLMAIPGVDIKGNVQNKVSVVSFTVAGVHPQDIGILLDNYGVAVRTGSHCTMPLMECLGITGTTRASFACYNTREEIDIMVKSLDKVIKMLQ
jgi:cysteine desulfurase / selenocysteine lyase